MVSVSQEAAWDRDDPWYHALRSISARAWYLLESLTFFDACESLLGKRWMD